MIVQINRPRVVGATIATVSSRAVQQGGTSGSASQSVMYKRYHIQTPQIVWVIPHNQNTDRFVYVLRNDSGEPITAKLVRRNNNVFEVHLTSALSGYVDLIFDISNASTIML